MKQARRREAVDDAFPKRPDPFEIVVDVQLVRDAVATQSKRALDMVREAGLDIP